MKSFKLLVFIVFVYTTSLFATPEFARERQADCSVCHTNIPMLNATGESYLRNGFRFSSADETSLKKFLSPKDKKSRHIPFAVMLRESYSSKNNDDSQKVKLYSGGTLSKNLSFFAVTQKVFNNSEGKNSKEPDFFDEKSSRAYLQLNLDDDKHVFRVGLMSPYTQFGNIQKAFADAGLNGGNGESRGNNMGTNNNYLNQNRRYGEPGGTYGGGYNQGGQGRGGQQGHRNSDGFGNPNYQTPLQQASFSKFKGGEYSYLYNSKVMFLVSYGESIDESDPQGRGNNTLITKDNKQFIVGIRYFADNGIKIGVLYNKFENNREDTYSLLFPIEKSFDKFLLNTVFVYKNNDLSNDYYGMQNALVYNINDTSNIRAIVNIDKDEDENNNYGYSLGYTKMLKSKLMFRLTGTKIDSQKVDDDFISASVSLFF